MRKIKSKNYLTLKIFDKKCYIEKHDQGWLCACVDAPYLARTGKTMTDAASELRAALERDTRFYGLMPAARLLYDHPRKSYKKLVKYYWYKILQGRRQKVD